MGVLCLAEVTAFKGRSDFERPATPTHNRKTQNYQYIAFAIIFASHLCGSPLDLLTVTYSIEKHDF